MQVRDCKSIPRGPLCIESIVESHAAFRIIAIVDIALGGERNCVKCHSHLGRWRGDIVFITRCHHYRACNSKQPKKFKIFHDITTIVVTNCIKSIQIDTTIWCVLSGAQHFRTTNQRKILHPNERWVKALLF